MKFAKCSLNYCSDESLSVYCSLSFSLICCIISMCLMFDFPALIFWNYEKRSLHSFCKTAIVMYVDSSQESPTALHVVHLVLVWRVNLMPVQCHSKMFVLNTDRCTTVCQHLLLVSMISFVNQSTSCCF